MKWISSAAFAAVAVVILAGCDPGRESYSRCVAQKDKDPLAALVACRDAVQKAPNKDSGKKANQLLPEISEAANKIIEANAEKGRAAAEAAAKERAAHVAQLRRKVKRRYYSEDEDGTCTAYLRYLKEGGAGKTSRLVSLTGRTPTVAMPEGVVSRIWNDVSCRLQLFLDGGEVQHPLLVEQCRFAALQLVGFLKGQNLAYDKVQSDLNRGIDQHMVEYRDRPLASPLLAGKQQSLERLRQFPELAPLFALMNLTKSVLEQLPEPPQVRVGSGGGAWFGVNINQLEFFCSVDLRAPHLLQLDRWARTVPDNVIPELGGVIELGKRWRWRYTLNLEEAGFFNMAEPEQRACLTKFLKEGLEYGRGLPEGPTEKQERE